jgi:hypothetical protein
MEVHMSNYQMLRAVAVRWDHSSAIANTDSQIIKPTDIAWWDHFVEFMQDRYDSPTKDVQRARKGELPRFFYPKEGSIVTPNDGWEILSGDYWASILMDYEFFWQSLWKAGNRGRVVAEFQMEQSFDYNDISRSYLEFKKEDRFYIPGDGGGMYTVCIDLTDDGYSCVVHYDDESFYRDVKEAYQDALRCKLEEEGVQSEDDLEEGYFEWYTSDEVKEYYIHQRFDLIDYPESAAKEMSRGFSA